MTLNRRDLILGAGAALTVSSLPAEAASASRVYKAYFGKRHIGGQVLNISRKGSVTSVRLQTQMVGKILGYSIDYEIDSKETWKNGVLQSIESKAKDDGGTHFVSARRGGGGLKVKGSGFNGVVAGNPGSSSFFVPDIMLRRTWVSNQSGRPWAVETQKIGNTNFKTDVGTMPCTRFQCTGDLKFRTDVYFTKNGELAGYTLSRFGLKVKFLAQSMDQKFAPLWA